MANKRIKDLSTTATKADLVSGNYLAIDGIAGTKKLSGDVLAIRNINPSEFDGLVFKIDNGGSVVYFAFSDVISGHSYKMQVERLSGAGGFSWGAKLGGNDLIKYESGVYTSNVCASNGTAELWLYSAGAGEQFFRVSFFDVDESQKNFDDLVEKRISLRSSFYVEEEASYSVHIYPLGVKANTRYIFELDNFVVNDKISISGYNGGTITPIISNYTLTGNHVTLSFYTASSYEGFRVYLAQGASIKITSTAQDLDDISFTQEGDGLVVSASSLDSMFGSLVLVTMPNTLYSEVKFVGESDTRRLSSGFSFEGKEKIEKLKLLRVDGSTLSSLTTTEAAKFKIYRINSKDAEYDVSFANALSSADECDAADFVVARANAQLLLQAAIACKSCIKIRLFRGDYILTELHECYCTKTGETTKALLSTFDGYIYQSGTENVYREAKTIEIIGKHQHLPENHDEPRTAYMPRLRVSYAVVSAISGTNCTGLLIPKSNDADLDGDGGVSLHGASNTGTNIVMKNIVVQDDYSNGSKNFVYVDFLNADSVTIENCRVFATPRLTSITTNDGVPMEGFVGIRVGRGSNKGIGCAVKHSYVEGVFYGYDISGEHYLMEDCQVRHCVCALRLGGMITRWSQIHPVTLVGCSFEACQRLIELDRYGKGATYTSPVRALQVVNLSSEDSLSVSGFLPSPKIGIVPKSKGAWSGKIDLCFRDKVSDYETQGVAINPVTGEGAENIIVDNLVCKVCGETSERPPYFPYDGFMFFDKTLGKPVFAKVGTCAKIKVVVNSSSATAGTAGFSIGGFYSPVKFGANKGTQADVVATFEKWLKFACYQDVKIENGNEITFTNPRPRSISAVLYDAGATGVSITSYIVADGSYGAWVDAEGNAV